MALIKDENRPLNLMLVWGGLAGFIWGIFFHSCWQVAVEGAQVIAGIVHYPSDNPFYIYQIKAWTLLHQIPALGLKFGLSEKFLSIFLSGVMGCICVQVLSLSVYVFARDVWISMFTAALIYYSNAYALGVNYPVFLVSTSATYGAIGLSFFFLSAGLLAAGKVRLGAFFLGLAIAVHAGIGLLGSALVLLAVFQERNQNEVLKKGFLIFYALGLAGSAASYLIQWPLIRSIPTMDPAVAKDYFISFIQLWDSHRQPVDFTHPGVRINGVLWGYSWIWLRFFRKELCPGAALMIRIYQLMAAAALFFSLFSWMPAAFFPAWFLSLMSTRILNIAILGFPGFLMGLWACHRQNTAAKLLLLAAVILLGQPILNLFLMTFPALCGYRFLTEEGGREKLTEWIKNIPVMFRPFAALLCAALIVKTGLFAYRSYEDRTNENWAFWKNSAFYQMVSKGEGLLLLSPDLYMQQLITRRPVLLDAQALDMAAYALEAFPAMDKILKQIYRVDLFNPPPESRGTAALQPGAELRLLENRTLEDWKKIRRDFGVTQFLTSKGSAVNLPLIVSNDDYELYEIPDGARDSR